MVAYAADKVVDLRKNHTNILLVDCSDSISYTFGLTGTAPGAVHVKLPLESTSVDLNFEQEVNCFFVTLTQYEGFLVEYKRVPWWFPIEQEEKDPNPHYLTSISFTFSTL